MALRPQSALPSTLWRLGQLEERELGMENLDQVLDAGSNSFWNLPRAPLLPRRRSAMIGTPVCSALVLGAGEGDRDADDQHPEREDDAHGLVNEGEQEEDNPGHIPDVGKPARHDTGAEDKR